MRALAQAYRRRRVVRVGAADRRRRLVDALAGAFLALETTDSALAHAGDDAVAPAVHRPRGGARTEEARALIGSRDISGQVGATVLA